MTAAELERFLRQEIPITGAMQLEVRELGAGRLRLAAPLAPNRNDKGTAFGGSLASLLLLAGWGLLHAELLASEPEVDIVIHRSELSFERPVHDFIEVSCTLPGQDTWQHFSRVLRARGRGRIALACEAAGADGAVAARMAGHYVAMRRAAPARAGALS